MLRRGNDSELCAPCARVAGGAAPGLPADFYTDPEVVAAFADRDFGRFFRTARAHLGITQEEFGLLVGLAQSRVCKIENGAAPLRDFDSVVRMASALGTPPELLGFPAAAGSLDGDGETLAVSWLQRRDFMAVATATALAVGTGLPLDEQVGTFTVGASGVEPLRRVGQADVARIEATTAAFRDWDNRWGGGLSSAAVVGQLHWLAATGKSAVVSSETVRRRLMVATADLASLAAWVHYDIERHDEARRLWMLGLDAAREADDVDLVSAILRQLAHQALHLTRADEALRLVRLAYAIAADSRRACELALSETSAYEAWCHAAAGNAQSCRRAAGRAEEHFTGSRPDAAPPWLAHFDEVELYALRGHAYHVLAQHTPEAAGEAEVWLRRAVAGRGPQYARSKTLNLIALASTYFQRRDGFDEGIRLGCQALEGASTLNSPRARSRLAGLDRLTARYTREPGVAEFRDRLRLVLADAA